MFRFPDPGQAWTLISRSGRQLLRICCRSCPNQSNDSFDGTGDRLDPIKISTGVGDRSGELWVLADVSFISRVLNILI